MAVTQLLVLHPGGYQVGPPFTFIQYWRDLLVAG